MIRAYYYLTKPGIVYGNMLAAIGGFFLASKGNTDPRVLGALFFGLSFIIASACAFNNVLDRKIDRVMTRTKKRPLPQGLISRKNALIYASTLLVLGSLVLLFFTTTLALVIALFGHFMYVVVYGYAKRKSPLGTEIGSIAGAVPPVVGYCAVTNQFDITAFLLFLVLVVWQMPHFHALAIGKLDDYKSVSIPVLPAVRGIGFTKKVMLLYVVAFIAIAPLLTLTGNAGFVYLVSVLALGGVWLWIGVRGWKGLAGTAWAWKMFRFSLVVLVVFSALISFEVVLP